MRKIRLNVEELEVSSFSVDAAAERRGTVDARSRSIYAETQCDYSRNIDQSCRNECFVYSWEYYTCEESGETRGASCDWECDSVQIC